MSVINPATGRAETNVERFNRLSKFDEDTECLVWQGQVNKGGYGTLTFRGKNYLAHRASYELFTGEIPDGMCVCHKCDNPLCVYTGHLFLGTHSDNMQDMLAKGRGNKASGSRSSVYDSRVFTFTHVDGETFTGTQRELIEEFSLTSSNVCNMVNRKPSYNSVKGWSIER